MKRNKFFEKCVSYAMAVISMAAIFVGCGNEVVVDDEHVAFTDVFIESISKDSPISEVSDFKQHFGIDYSEIPEEFIDIPIEVYDTIPHINDITQNELFTMDLQQIRAFVSVFEPNYRDVYSISEDKIMENEDWEMVRLLLSYQLYGSIRNPYEEDENIGFEQFTESIKEDFYEETIVLNEKDILEIETELEYIRGLSEDEFTIYMNEIFAEAGYTNEDGSAIDVTEEENVDLNEVKEALIQSIETQILESQSAEEDVTDTTTTILEGELESPLVDIESDAR